MKMSLSNKRDLGSRVVNFGKACADPGARTPIGAIGNLIRSLSPVLSLLCKNILSFALKVLQQMSHPISKIQPILLISEIYFPVANYMRLLLKEFLQSSQW